MLAIYYLLKEKVGRKRENKGKDAKKKRKQKKITLGRILGSSICSWAILFGVLMLPIFVLLSGRATPQYLLFFFTWLFSFLFTPLIYFLFLAGKVELPGAEKVFKPM